MRCRQASACASSTVTRGLVDTHCHLNHENFNEDRHAAIRRAWDSGLERLLVIGYDLASSRFAVELAGMDTRIDAVIGIHPEAASEWAPAARNELIEMAMASTNRVVAWGEIGLDYHWDTVPHDTQQVVFEQQIACALDLNLPVVLHCRDAYSELLETLERCECYRGVLHCFVGDERDARKAVDLGFYIGVGGIITFKKSDSLRDVISGVPLNRIILETDSPYLAPQPWRGKRNEPAYLGAVVDELAKLKGISQEEIIALTTANADLLFGPVRDQHFVDG